MCGSLKKIPIWFGRQGLVLPFTIAGNKKIEKGLLQTREHLQKIMDLSLDVICTANDKGQFVSINAASAKVWGYEPEELIGKPFLDFVYEEDREKTVLIAKNIIAGIKIMNFENRYKHKNGMLIPMLWSSHWVEDSKLMYGVARDITERKKEEIIKTGAEKYRNMVEQASDAIVIYSFDGTIHEFNNSAWTLSGYSKEEFSKLKLADILVGDIIADPANYKAILAGEIITFSRQMKRKDGLFIDMEVTVKMLADGKVIAFGRDITERKKAEEAIKKEKELSDSVINSLPGVFYFYDENLRLLRWNKQLENVTGYSAAELKRMNPVEFFEGEDRKYMQERSKKVFANGSGDAEASFSTKDGRRVPYYFTGHRMQYEGNPSLLGIGIDITERKKAEQEIVEINRQLRSLSEHLQNIREEERTNIAREIHDELGQQLTVMKIDVSWLSKKVGKLDKTIGQRAEDLKSLLDNAVVTVRKIASELRPSLLDDMGLGAAIEWQLSEFEKRSGIKTEADKIQIELSLANAIKTGLFRIVQESLTNVARYARAKKVTVSLQCEEGQVMLTIKDDGVGFNKEKLATKKTLGILGMKERTLMMKGTYEIDSAPGMGTTVTVKIPFEE